MLSTLRDLRRLRKELCDFLSFPAKLLRRQLLVATAFLEEWNHPEVKGPKVLLHVTFRRSLDVLQCLWLVVPRGMYLQFLHLSEFCSGLRSQLHLGGCYYFGGGVCAFFF